MLHHRDLNFAGRGPPKPLTLIHREGMVIQLPNMVCIACWSITTMKNLALTEPHRTGSNNSDERPQMSLSKLSISQTTPGLCVHDRPRIRTLLSPRKSDKDKDRDMDRKVAPHPLSQPSRSHS